MAAETPVTAPAISSIGRAPRKTGRSDSGPKGVLVVAGKAVMGTLIVLLALFPLAWMVIAGFKSRSEVVETPFQFFPEIWRFENYQQILADPEFVRSMSVTFAGALLFTVLSLTVNSLGAYAFARLEFAFKNVLWVYVITTMFIPGMAILLTSFVVVTRLRMLDTLAVLVLPGAASAAHLFFMRQYYLNVPLALEEAATLDGASKWAIYRHIFLPMSKPVFVVVGMTSFLAFWNSYVWPIMTITSRDLYQIQQYLATFRSERAAELGMLMAGSTLAALPVLILFLVFQRHIIGGIKIAGLK
ncbi:carbohydrate ABC transporter permease [Pseudactinotalea suaedae]|uniref:carbohydrate ABC transporter permease n=1 Tax=Pseudactinotalea suaedae TaxID=1524924 RepID=UPI0012E1838E|nr:carbohydrate ABC transporter permease [Pseudactinotalea suaedae]